MNKILKEEDNLEEILEANKEKYDGCVVIKIDISTMLPFKAEALIERFKSNFNNRGFGPEGWYYIWMPVRNQGSSVEFYRINENAELHLVEAYINEGLQLALSSYDRQSSETQALKDDLSKERQYSKNGDGIIIFLICAIIGIVVGGLAWLILA